MMMDLGVIHPEPVGTFFSSDIYIFTNINSIVSLKADPMELPPTNEQQQ
jgi:hypothetical protein